VSCSSTRLRDRFRGPSLWLLLIALALVVAGLGQAFEWLGRAAHVSELTEADFTAARHAMVADLQGRGLASEDVLQAMDEVPRHEFVSARYLSEAYEDHPIPVGEGQEMLQPYTVALQVQLGQQISQPYVVALMTELLDLKPGDKVLEIGTGTGYHAAVLAEIADSVYTIEINPLLGDPARERLERLGYGRIHTRIGDGYYGWPGEEPFDAIVVTTAPDHVPQPLIAQLRDGGGLVIPVGPPGDYQTLWRIEKRGDQLITKNAGPILTIPMTR